MLVTSYPRTFLALALAQAQIQLKAAHSRHEVRTSAAWVPLVGFCGSVHAPFAPVSSNHIDTTPAPDGETAGKSGPWDGETAVRLVSGAAAFAERAYACPDADVVIHYGAAVVEVQDCVPIASEPLPVAPGLVADA